MGFLLGDLIFALKVFQLMVSGPYKLLRIISVDGGLLSHLQNAFITMFRLVFDWLTGDYSLAKLVHTYTHKKTVYYRKRDNALQGGLLSELQWGIRLSSFKSLKNSLFIPFDTPAITFSWESIFDKNSNYWGKQVIKKHKWFPVQDNRLSAWLH